MRAALGLPARIPVGWYGHQDAGWIAHYDVLRRAGLARYTRAAEEVLDDWAVLARSTGWWWPGERHVVAVERPAEIRTVPVPGAWNEQVRTVAVAYRDGWRPMDG